MGINLKQREYVLLIEDSESDANLFLNVIKMKNFSGEVKVLKYGKEAIAFLLQNQGHLPKTIILDIGLPDMSGIELLQYIKEQSILCDIPVIVWTGFESPISKAESERLGALIFILKPLDLDEYERQVEWFLNCWNKV